MKLSFSLAGKSQSKKPSAASTSDAAKAFESSTPKPNGSTAKQFVTQFDPSEPSSQTLIIPPKPNEYRPFKKMKNLDLPFTQNPSSDSHPLQFELESASNVEPPPDSMSYGLNVRQSSGSNGGSRADPMLVKYKEDVGRLPDVAGFEEFEDMPVEGFGAALLAGYGWKEGRGIGRNAKEDVKIVEYKKWSGKEGLGFDKEAPQSVVSGKRDGKGGDEVSGRRVEKGRGDVGKEAREVDGRDGSSSRERRDRMSEDLSSRRSDRDVRDEELKDSRRERKRRGSEDFEKQSEDVRMEALAIDGRDGSSNSRERRDKTRESSSSRRRDGRDEELKGRRREQKHSGSEDAEKQHKDMRMELQAVDGRYGSSSRERRDKTKEDISSSRRDGRDEEFKDSRKKEKKHRGNEDIVMQSEDVRERGSQQSRKSERVIWLFSHIRVRVISKAVKGGKLYLKKGEVVDVVGPSCDILMDESRELVQGVSQEYLETALPKRGGPVLVLYGKHKGVYGSLMEKDSDKETGVVRDADNHELLNVRLEQIAEFIGDPSYIGY